MTFGDSTVLTSIAEVRRRNETTEKSRPLTAEKALGYITQLESKFFDRLLLAYGVLCLELRNIFSVTKTNWS